VRSAVTNLRKTNRPVAVAVDHGNHGWVLTGFTATADPARTTSFTVTSVRVTGPLWGLQSRTYGYDMHPDKRLTPTQFRAFFTPWHYRRVHMAWEGEWVSIQAIPTTTSSTTTASTTSEVRVAAPAAAPREAPGATPLPATTATAEPSATPLPTSVAVPIAAGPVTGGKPPAPAATNPVRTETRGDPWTILGLGAAAVLVLAAALLGGPGRPSRVRESSRARTAGTAPRRTS
jgi:hypothetical protein